VLQTQIYKLICWIGFFKKKIYPIGLGRAVVDANGRSDDALDDSAELLLLKRDCFDDRFEFGQKIRLALS